MTAAYCTRCNIYYESDTHKDCTGVQRLLNGPEAEKLTRILETRDAGAPVCDQAAIVRQVHRAERHTTA